MLIQVVQNIFKMFYSLWGRGDCPLWI